jgi:hypothetical protein
MTMKKLTSSLLGLICILFATTTQAQVAPEQARPSVFSITSDGVHSVEFWSVDVAGNTETHQTRTVKIDSTAPATQASTSGRAGTNGWYPSAVQVTLSASDNASGVAKHVVSS